MINLSQSIFYDDLTLSIMYIVTSDWSGVMSIMVYPSFRHRLPYCPRLHRAFKAITLGVNADE